RNPLLTPLDLHEHADRCFVKGEHDVRERVLLTILLIPEPHAIAKLLEAAHQTRAVSDDGLDFLAGLDRRMLYRAFERQEALAGLDPHAKHASPSPERLLLVVEQKILLETPA